MTLTIPELMLIIAYLHEKYTFMYAVPVENFSFATQFKPSEDSQIIYQYLKVYDLSSTSAHLLSDTILH
jgi:hemolysin activation/secretion protein